MKNTQESRNTPKHLNPMKETTAIGLMSGSSLDGLDIALVKFSHSENEYHFEIIEADTVAYPNTWKQALSEAFNKQPAELTELDKSYGKYLGEQVLAFVRKHNAHADFVASHGHTIFHRPHEGYTLQIGHGQELANACGLTVVNDFRTEDVGKGGQGAPLVPIGDMLLFGHCEICLNIGGIANVSYNVDDQRIAYDLCMANQALNHLAQQSGLDYDSDGLLARSGTVDAQLLTQLNQHPFYGQQPPKSLGREFFETYQKDILRNVPIANSMATFVEHIAMQIAAGVNNLPKGKMLVTGGGAHNKFLVERLKIHTTHDVVIPEKTIIDYKEALVFAFLGLRRLEGNINVLSSVTGAVSDSCSGMVWRPTQQINAIAPRQQL